MTPKPRSDLVEGDLVAGPVVELGVRELAWAAMTCAFSKAPADCTPSERLNDHRLPRITRLFRDCVCPLLKLRYLTQQFTDPRQVIVIVLGHEEEHIYNVH